jgi:hypothetical protein
LSRAVNLSRRMLVAGGPVYAFSIVRAHVEIRRDRRWKTLQITNMYAVRCTLPKEKERHRGTRNQTGRVIRRRGLTSRNTRDHTRLSLLVAQPVASSQYPFPIPACMHACRLNYGMMCVYDSDGSRCLCFCSLCLFRAITRAKSHIVGSPSCLLVLSLPPPPGSTHSSSPLSALCRIPTPSQP